MNHHFFTKTNRQKLALHPPKFGLISRRPLIIFYRRGKYIGGKYGLKPPISLAAKSPRSPTRFRRKSSFIRSPSPKPSAASLPRF